MEATQPHSGLRMIFLPDFDHLSFTISVGTPLCPYAIAYYPLAGDSRDPLEVCCVGWQVLEYKKRPDLSEYVQPHDFIFLALTVLYVP